MPHEVITNNGNAPVGTPDIENYQVTDIQVGTDDIVSCVFYNITSIRHAEDGDG